MDDDQLRAQVRDAGFFVSQEALDVLKQLIRAFCLAHPPPYPAEIVELVEEFDVEIP